MYTELYQYLLQHKELPVPGIGTFLLERKPAETDFPNKQINPPVYSIALQPGSYVPGKGFFTWLAKSLGSTDREAIFRFNDFAFDMKKQIGEGDSISWNGVGILNKGLGGDLKFTASDLSTMTEKPVKADKVIRLKATHAVRVGEDQRTSVEMTEMLAQQEEKKSYWWAYALALALAAIIYIGWHFSEKGLDITAIANSEKSVPLEATADTYQLYP